METRLSSDAGNISVISHDLAVKYGGIKKVNLKNGLFVEVRATCDVLTVRVEDTWNGDVEKDITSEDGELYYVGDACYIINDAQWDQFLKDTIYMEKMPKGSACLNTGGDGSFKVIIEN